ncbi:MAG: hypothetical protein AAB666_01570 [Patescibacteria group bacterium]
MFRSFYAVVLAAMVLVLFGGCVHGRVETKSSALTSDEATTSDVGFLVDSHWKEEFVLITTCANNRCAQDNPLVVLLTTPSHRENPEVIVELLSSQGEGVEDDERFLRSSLYEIPTSIANFYNFYLIWKVEGEKGNEVRAKRRMVFAFRAKAEKLRHEPPGFAEAQFSIVYKRDIVAVDLPEPICFWVEAAGGTRCIS